MKMKKKALTLCLAVALAATAVVGGTMAYFTDTDSKKNTFTVGNVDIQLVEKGADKEGNEVNWDSEDAVKELMPGWTNTTAIKKSVTVENTGDNDAYCWIEVWVPSALDDGDDNSPAAPGLGKSLHFNYDAANVGIEETKAAYLGTKVIDEVPYNGYVHFVPDSDPIAPKASTVALLDKVYMDGKVTQGADGNLILADGKTSYDGDWNLVINAVGFQAAGIPSIEDAISEYYGKPVSGYLW